MSGSPDFWEAVAEIRSRDDRFASEFYCFIIEALDHTITSIGERRHLSAVELVDGMCRYARDRFGMLAYTMLEHWGVRSTRDVGDAVYHLVDAGVLSKQDSDRLEDFENGQNLKKVLEDLYFD